MHYAVFTDGASNLPGKYLQGMDIHPLPCSYTMDGEPGVYMGDIDAFDAKLYYDKLRAGSRMKTSLLNSQLFQDQFRPYLEQGLDVVYVGMSSGISGTIQAARIAAEELMEDYPERTVRVVDSLGAAFGPGLLACRAADLRGEGKSAGEAGAILDEEVKHLLQLFFHHFYRHTPTSFNIWHFNTIFPFFQFARPKSSDHLPPAVNEASADFEFPPPFAAALPHGFVKDTAESTFPPV